MPSYDKLNDKLECFSFIDCHGTQDNWEKFIKNYLIIYCAFRKLACDGILEHKDTARRELKTVQDDKLFCYQAAEVNTEAKKSKDDYIWFWSKFYMVKAKQEPEWYSAYPKMLSKEESEMMYRFVFAKKNVNEICDFIEQKHLQGYFGSEDLWYIRLSAGINPPKHSMDIPPKHSMDIVADYIEKSREDFTKAWNAFQPDLPYYYKDLMSDKVDIDKLSKILRKLHDYSSDKDVDRGLKIFNELHDEMNPSKSELESVVGYMFQSKDDFAKEYNKSASEIIEEYMLFKSKEDFAKEHNKSTSEIKSKEESPLPEFYKDFLHNVGIYRTEHSFQKDFIENSINFIKRGVRIASFTKTYKNPPMWAHYAANHKGICIGYNLSALLTDVSYFDVDSRESYNLFEVLKYKLDNQATSDFIKNVSTKKTTHWKYEEEMRFINQYGYDRIQGPDGTISEIILGVDIGDKNKEEIIKILDDTFGNGSSRPKLYQAFFTPSGDIDKCLLKT